MALTRAQARANLRRAISKTVDYLARNGIDLPPDLLTWRGEPESMSIRGAGKPGAKTKEANAVNAYTEELQRIYQDWVDDLADELADAPEDWRDEIIETALATLLLLLRQVGHAALPEAVTLGVGAHTPDGDILALLVQAMRDNDNYLAESLMLDIRQKLRNAFLDDDVRQALATGTGAAALAGVLATMMGRVASRAGTFWNLFNQTAGETARDQGYPVRWNRDERAKHCDDCLEFGEQTYASYDDMLSQTGGISPANRTICGDNCRCWLDWVTE